MIGYTKILTVILLGIMLFEISAFGQTAKRKNDVDERELSGKVREIRLTRKLLITLDGDKEFGDGWIPGLTVFNRNGYQERFEAYNDEGEYQYKIVSQFNSSGQKIEEIETNADGRRNRKRTFAYDKDGNQIESNGYYGEDDKYNQGYRLTYDDKGFMTSLVELDRENKVVRTVYISRNGGNHTESTSSYNGEGKFFAKTYETFSDDKNQQNSESAFLDENGNPTSRYVTTTDNKGNVTDVEYDSEGKVLEKQVYV